MKKVTIGAIAVLFLLVGSGYASNPQLNQNHLITNMAGPLTSLTLYIYYEQELPATSSLLQGQGLVSATSFIGRRLTAAESTAVGGYKYEDDPVIYMWVDGNGNLSQINMTWKSPSDPGGAKIWTINCRGGNQTGGITGSGTPGLGLGGVPTIEDGTISTLPRLYSSAAATTSAETDTVRGVLACSICPDGFQIPSPETSPPTITGTTCNGGESYINGYLTFTGTFYYDLLTETITSASITGTLAGGSFNYIGETWAATPCTTYGTFECKAIFTGTFAAKLTACPTPGDPFCWISFP